MTDTQEGFVLHYKGHAVYCRPGETVLDAFLRANVPINFSCKSGVCHRCMVRCTSGDIPVAAQRKLPAHQRERACLLSCQCHPTGPMVLAPKSPEDLLTRCQLSAFHEQEGGGARLAFEPFTRLDYRQGQLAMLCNLEQQQECRAVFAVAPDGDIIEIDVAAPLPAWLQASPPEGLEFFLRGPLPEEPTAEVMPFPPTPGLWERLGGDSRVRAILEDFYRKVYADPELKPFFARVTMDRVIGKQFAFLKQSMTGESVYLGEMPRNNHHWMVISDSLFDHRQQLMLQSLRDHGVDDELMALWRSYEEQFRPDIVKYKPWLKKVGDIHVDTERYEEVRLDEASICDYCGDEIAKGTLVRFHFRLGHLGCERCSRSGADRGTS